VKTCVDRRPCFGKLACRRSGWLRSSALERQCIQQGLHRGAGWRGGGGCRSPGLQNRPLRASALPGAVLPRAALPRPTTQARSRCVWWSIQMSARHERAAGRAQIQNTLDAAHPGHRTENTRRALPAWPGGTSHDGALIVIDHQTQRDPRLGGGPRQRRTRQYRAGQGRTRRSGRFCNSRATTPSSHRAAGLHDEAPVVCIWRSSAAGPQPP